MRVEVTELRGRDLREGRGNVRESIDKMSLLLTVRI